MCLIKKKVPSQNRNILFSLFLLGVITSKTAPSDVKYLLCLSVKKQVTIQMRVKLYEICGGAACFLLVQKHGIKRNKVIITHHSIIICRLYGVWHTGDIKV